MLFRDIIGQEEVKNQLVDLVRNNRLSHAILFLGKEGSGGLPLAMAFANYIASLPKEIEAPATDLFGAAIEPAPLPSTPAEADSWMEAHPGFSKTTAMVHPDIHYSYPVISKKPSPPPPISTDYITEWREFIKQLPYANVFDWLQFINAENKQGNITAHECNDILRKLNLKSFESGYKILVMWMPEYLGKEGNKLLKLIEEPPADTLFILVAESEASILSTILSRCQLIKIPGIKGKEMEEALVKRAGCNPGQAKMLSNASNGNYREALHLLQHADEDFNQLLKEWLNASLRNQALPQVKAIEEIAKLGRERQKQFIRHFIHLLESALRLQVAGAGQVDEVANTMAEAELEFALKINKAMNLDHINALTGELDRASYYIERNANAKILFHALTIKIFHIVKNNLVVSV
jgi:DNA polymerase III subunit delta'